MLSQPASRHQKTQFGPSGQRFLPLRWQAKELTLIAGAFFIQSFFAQPNGWLKR